MGAEQSYEEQQPVSIEELTTLLTNRFASKSYTQLEVYVFSHLFNSLADSSSGLHHFSETTLTRFLELPDALGAGSVLFQMATWLGAFPFPSQAPAILEKAALLRVITLAAKRYGDVLPGLTGEKGRRWWWGEVYRSMAVYDRGVGEDRNSEEKHEEEKKNTEAAEYSGFAIDAPGEDPLEEDEEDDGLVLAALDSMSALDVFGQGEKADLQHSFIPADNLLKVIELLLLIAPLGPQDSVAAHSATQLSDDERIEELRKTARDMLAAFGDSGPGIGYKAFMKVVETSLPTLFEPLGPLFEHFLFAKDFDLSKRKVSTASAVVSPTSPTSEKSPSSPDALSPPPQLAGPAHPEAPIEIPPLPALLPPNTPLLTVPRLSQMSFFLPPPLFGHLVPLYAGSTHGFSMGAFEKHVFNWQAPTIMLVKGSLLPPAGSSDLSPRERHFLDTLPPKKLPTSRSRLGPRGYNLQQGPRAATASPPASPITSRDANNEDEDEDDTVLYGAYIPTPWKPTPKHHFSDSTTQLFQLSPHHAVHRASSLSSEYVYFNKNPTQPAGLGLGSPIKTASQASKASSSRGSWGHDSFGSNILQLGAVSLHLDDALEFGVFTHLGEGGGSFMPVPTPPSSGFHPRAHRASVVQSEPAPTPTSASAPDLANAHHGPTSPDFRDPFLIEEVMILGVGGADEAERQRKAWEWEEREAERRRRINLGTGDIEADKELLKMAGLVGGDRSGGSMG